MLGKGLQETSPCRIFPITMPFQQQRKLAAIFAWKATAWNQSSQQDQQNLADQVTCGRRKRYS